MSAVSRLPLVPAPPDDPTSFVLAGTIGQDRRAGSRVGRLDKVRVAETSDCACLVLAPGLAGARRWSEAYGSFGGLRLPTNVAVAESGDVYLLDRTRGRLLRFDPCGCEFKEVTCRSSSARARDDAWFLGATAIAVCHGDLFVANPRLGRVLRLALNGLLLREALAPPRGRPGSLPTGQTWRPTALAIDGTGTLWAASRENGRIDRFAPTGKWREPGGRASVPSRTSRSIAATASMCSPTAWGVPEPVRRRRAHHGPGRPTRLPGRVPTAPLSGRCRGPAPSRRALPRSLRPHRHLRPQRRAHSPGRRFKAPAVPHGGRLHLGPAGQPHRALPVASHRPRRGRSREHVGRGADGDGPARAVDGRGPGPPARDLADPRRVERSPRTCGGPRALRHRDE